MRRYLTTPAILFVVALIGITFFAASNHCSLSVMTSLSKAGHSCCHEENDAGQPRNMLECCTSLPAPLPATLSAPAAHLFVLQPLWGEVPPSLEVSAPVPVGTFSDTGPPGLKTFAESVLNRSLLAHAPPVFVV